MKTKIETIKKNIEEANSVIEEMNESLKNELVKVNNSIEEIAAARIRLNGINTVEIEEIKLEIDKIWRRLVIYYDDTIDLLNRLE